MIETPILVKDEYENDKSDKAIRIVFTDGSRNDLTNEDIVEETVVFTESLCSQETLKFGLCEASMIEFECIVDGNIKGKQIKVIYEIKYVDENGKEKTHQTQMGIFNVDSCVRMPWVNTKKVIAFDALKSSNLDTDVTEKARDYITNHEPWQKGTIYELENKLLSEFKIKSKKVVHEIEMPYLFENIGTVIIYNNYNTQPTYHFRAIISAVKIKVNHNDYFTIFMTPQLMEQRKIDLRNMVNQYINVGDRGTFDWTAIDQWIEQQMFKIEGNLFNGGSTPQYYPGNPETEDYTNILEFQMEICTSVELHNGAFTGSKDTLIGTKSYESVNDFSAARSATKINRVELSEIEKETPFAIPDKITLRNILQAVYELKGQFGVIDKITGEVFGKTFDRLALYPANDRYPANSLYPSGANKSFRRGELIEVTTQQYETKKYGKISYKHLVQGVEQTEIKQTTQIIDENNENTYFMPDNWMLNNMLLMNIWTIIGEMGEKIKDISYTPVITQQIGFPFVEVGDMVEYTTDDGTITSYVLQRRLSGIHALFDAITANGKEINVEQEESDG